MSQRTTDKTGAAVAEGINGEGAPVETDPFGSNVGISTPYIGSPGGYTPEPQYPMLHPFFEDSPQYINGQQVSATLDGFPIPYATAMQMLQGGSAIPAWLEQYQHLPGFSFEHIGVGIFRTHIPDIYLGGRVVPHGSMHPEGRIFTGGIFYSTVSWSSHTADIVYGKPFKVPREFMPLVSQVVNGFLDKNPNCENFINSLLAQLSKDTGLKLEGDIRHFIKEFEKNGNLTLVPISSTDPATQVSSGGQANPLHRFGTPEWGFEVLLTQKFYDRTVASNLSTFLHELIHAIGNRDKSYFGDDAAANAVYNMGLMKISPSEYAQQPENAKLLEEYRKAGYSTQAIPSKYWAGTLAYACGAASSPSPLMKK